MNHHVAKGVQNRNNGNRMTWWKSNFNMPTLNIGDGTVWLEAYGPVAYDSPDTSFDLTGFFPGWEIVVFCCIWHWDGPVSGTAYLYSRWCNPAGSTIFNCANGLGYALNVASEYWSEYWYGCNIGCAGWEVTSSGNYSVRSYSTGAGAMSEQSTTIAFSNVPSTTQLAASRAGYIWVEGNDLCFVNANQWKHTIVGTDNGYVDTEKSGFMWIDNSNWLHWIGLDGHNYQVPWKIQEFASTWSNSSNDATAPGASYKGCIWVDSEYGWTHLGYIGYDGHKYIVGSGHDPYIAPY
jgi:hypothetical protein